MVLLIHNADYKISDLRLTEVQGMTVLHSQAVIPVIQKWSEKLVVPVRTFEYSITFTYSSLPDYYVISNCTLSEVLNEGFMNKLFHDISSSFFQTTNSGKGLKTGIKNIKILNKKRNRNEGIKIQIEIDNYSIYLKGKI